LVTCTQAILFLEIMFNLFFLRTFFCEGKWRIFWKLQEYYSFKMNYLFGKHVLKVVLYNTTIYNKVSQVCENFGRPMEIIERKHSFQCSTKYSYVFCFVLLIILSNRVLTQYLCTLFALIIIPPCKVNMTITKH